MANIKSQIKRNRQNDKRRLRNRTFRGSTRVAVRDARTAIDTGKPDKAAVLEAISRLDKVRREGRYSQEQRRSPQKPPDEGAGRCRNQVIQSEPVVVLTAGAEMLSPFCV